MTTGDPWVCPKCGSSKGRLQVDTYPSYQVCSSCNEVVDIKTFSFDDVPPDKRPPPVCPSCQRPATWRLSDEHAESCYQCCSCGGHYSRQRLSVYVPVGMTLEQAQELLVQTPMGNAAAEHDVLLSKIVELAKQLGVAEKARNVWSEFTLEKGDKLRELETRFAGMEEENKKLEGLLSEAVSRGEELSHSIRRLDAGDDDAQDRALKASEEAKGRQCRWCNDGFPAELRSADPLDMGLCVGHTENLLSERKKSLETENRALEMLWHFVDELNATPRSGNVFDRANEALDTARRVKGVGADMREEIEVLRQYGNKDCTAMADAEIAERRSKVNPICKS